jgi:hypothetical protein
VKRRRGVRDGGCRTKCSVMRVSVLSLYSYDAGWDAWLGSSKRRLCGWGRAIWLFAERMKIRRKETDGLGAALTGVLSAVQDDWFA